MQHYSSASAVDLVGFDFLYQAPAARAQVLGGVGAVAVVALQGLGDQFAFHLGEDLFEFPASGDLGCCAGVDSLRDVGAVDALLAAAQQGGAFHLVLQFADIAGPVVGAQGVQGRGSEAGGCRRLAFLLLGQEVQGQVRNVFAALAQGR